jgi:hypothetical protein
MAGKALTYDVHERTPGDFVWFVHDADGELVDSWSKRQKVRTAGDDAIVTGAETFRSERDAVDHVRKRHPNATDVHTRRKD